MRNTVVSRRPSDGGVSRRRAASCAGWEEMVDDVMVQVASERYQVAKPCPAPLFIPAATTAGQDLRLGP